MAGHLGRPCMALWGCSDSAPELARPSERLSALTAPGTAGQGDLTVPLPPLLPACRHACLPACRAPVPQRGLSPPPSLRRLGHPHAAQTAHARGGRPTHPRAQGAPGRATAFPGGLPALGVLGGGLRPLRYGPRSCRPPAAASFMPASPFPCSTDRFSPGEHPHSALQTASPSDALVDEHLAAFIQALEALFEKHKAEVGHPSERLTIH